MGTDWFVKMKCWKGLEKGRTEEDHIKHCLKCPYVKWETPKSVAGIFHIMCGVGVGNAYRTAALDDMRKYLNDTEGFIELDGCPSAKKAILERIKHHAEKTGWTIKGFSKAETIVWLDMLIAFCKRAEEKGLDIVAWA